MVSKADIKYTNSKVIIRLFSFNVRRKYAFFKKYIKLSILIRRQVYKRLYNKFISQLRKKIYYDLLPMLVYRERFRTYKRFNNRQDSFVLACQPHNPFIDGSKGDKPGGIVMLKYMLVNNIAKNINQYIMKHYVLSRRIRNKFLYRLEKRVRTYEYLYILNKYKFERTKLLPLLTRLLNKHINKKIEYNIINLKSLVYSPDIFTNFINLKIKKLNKARLGSASTSSYLKRVYAKVLKLEREKENFLAMKNFEDDKRYIFHKRYINSNLICLLKERNVNSFFEYIFPSFSLSYVKLAGMQEKEKNLNFPRHLKRKYRYIPKKFLLEKIRSLFSHFRSSALASSILSMNFSKYLDKKPGSSQASSLSLLKKQGTKPGTSLIRTGNESKVHLGRIPNKLVERLTELQGNFLELVSKIPVPFYKPSRDLIKEAGEYKTKKRKLISSFRVERKRLIGSLGNNRKKLNMKLDKLVNYFNKDLSKINAKGILIESNKRYYKILRKSKCRNDLISLKSKYENRIL
jgi:hypothetical protein